MNKRLVIIVVAILVVAGIVFGLTRNKNDNSAPTQSNSNTSQPAKSNNSSAQTPPASSSSVSIENFAFMQPDITVKKGATVTWTNNDNTTHTVTEMDGQTGPNSGNLSPGSKYNFTFNTAGTFKYRCNIHPSMLGTVTVTD